MNITNNNKTKITDFFRHLFPDGFLEVVIDYTTSKYFDLNEIPDVIDYSIEMANKGHEVHFGPAVRKEDLGTRRSDANNILYSKCLWVDIDSPDKTLSAEKKVEEAKRLLKEFSNATMKYRLKPSYVVSSGHGFHLYFITQRAYVLPIPEWSEMQNALINLAKADVQAKDPGRLLRVPGTLNHKDKENPREVKIIYGSGDIVKDDILVQIVKDYGVKATQANITPSEVKPLGFKPPCIEYLLDLNNKPNKGHRHQVRVILGTFGYHEGWELDDMIQKVMHTTDDPKKAENDIRGVYSTLERDPTRYTVGCNAGSSLRNLVDAGITVCDKANCGFEKPELNKEEEDKKETYSAWFDGLVDLVLDDNGKLAFLVKKDGRLIIEDKHKTLEEGILVPPPKKAIRWSVPKGTEVMRYFSNDNDSQLFEDLIGYHRAISELPTEDHYKYLAVWDMHTYMYDKGEYSPYVWLYAIPVRGKTRTGKGLIYVAWRGLHLITLREPNIFRMARDQRATMFFDITDLWKKAESAGVEDVMLSRFERGATIARVLFPDKGAFEDTEYYHIYGPTIIATNEPVDNILETRAVQIIMPESARQFEEDIRPEGGLPFRERLVAFRARWMDRQLPNAEKPVSGRLGDILRPLRQIVKIVCQDETWFLDLAKDLEEKRKKEGMETLDAQVVSAIYEARHRVKNGHLFHADVLPIINQNRPERYWMSPHKLGRITAKLGFEKYSNKSRGICFNEDLVNRLCERYGIKQDNLTF